MGQMDKSTILSVYQLQAVCKTCWQPIVELMTKAIVDIMNKGI